MNKNDIFYIRAKLKRDYVYDGIKNDGYDICIPYRDHNLVMRALREMWFRLHLPFKKIWYNPQIKKIKAKTIVLNDPLITPDLLKWIRELYPDARIILDYENRAYSTISPVEAKEYVTEMWSYALDDCEKYGMKYKTYAIRGLKPITETEYKYDVTYVGRDKGRAGKILELEKQMNDMGIKTYFHICADRAYFSKQKPFYKPVLDYEEYLELFKSSKAILNIMPEGQRSVTQRDIEAVEYGIKCITNSKFIKETELYHPSRFFVLGDDALEKLPEFLAGDYVWLDEATVIKHSKEKIYEAMFGD